MRARILKTAVVLTALSLLVACSEKTAPQQAAEEPLPAAATLPRSASPPGARVFFISPADGATVSSPVRIEFGLEGMQVVPAGQQQAASGHHHLLIDTGLPDTSQPIPADAQHVHFGDGSTATEIELAPGEYTLRLLLGDHLHIPHDPPLVSEPITITVE